MCDERKSGYFSLDWHSLAGRLYEKAFGKEFTQKQLGHKSEKMTEKYLDVREKVFRLI